MRGPLPIWLAALALVPVLVSPLAGTPVIDDPSLEASFIRGLRRPGVDGLRGAAAAAALAAAAGKSVAVQGEGRPAADYESACRSVVVVGTVSHCGECGEFHMDSVSTGWILDPAGRVVTNYHVLEDKDAGELGVMTVDGKVYPVRSVLAADREGDAAVLAVDVGRDRPPALPLAAATRTGEPVRVVGHPDGRFYTLTEGIVSRVFSQGADENRRTWVSVTADYGSGSSGAPVLNAAGEVLGMVSSTAALLADTADEKPPEAADVQMVFKDCVSTQTMRKLLGARQVEARAEKTAGLGSGLPGSAKFHR